MTSCDRDAALALFVSITSLCTKTLPKGTSLKRFVYQRKKRRADEPFGATIIFWFGCFRDVDSSRSMISNNSRRRLSEPSRRKHRWCISKLCGRLIVTNSVDTRNMCASSNCDDCLIKNMNSLTSSYQF